jgi:hypothetical protein
VNSQRHLRLRHERDELGAVGRDAGLPDRRAAALMDEGRVADQRRAGRRGGDEVGLALERRRALGAVRQIDAPR